METREAIQKKINLLLLRTTSAAIKDEAESDLRKYGEEGKKLWLHGNPLKSQDEITYLILSALFQKRKKGPLKLHQGIFNAVMLARWFARRKHVSRFIKLLFWEEFLGEDSSYRWEILIAVREKGNRSHIPLLKKYFAEIKKIKYRRRKNMVSPQRRRRDDQEDVEYCIAHIKRHNS